jgi:hypothetical protein
MQEYVVYREGFDEKTQSPERGLPYQMPVLRIMADSPEEACRKAAQQVPLAANQHLTAEPASVADAREHSLNVSPRLPPEEEEQP